MGPASKSKAAPPFGKRLHWKPLPELSLEDTIFEELSPWGEVVPALDKEQLERIFLPPASTRERTTSGCSSEGQAAKGWTPAGKGSGTASVCLLDAKRAQNLYIVLRQVTVPTHELAEVLRWMRIGHPVTVETLDHVYENLLPSLLECSELMSFDGPAETLRDVERQLLPLARLPRLKARLRTMLFGKNLPSLHSSILARIRLLQNACDQVRSSLALRRILEMALRVGNYLNDGVECLDAGDSSGVRGITMDSLLKLREFRAPHGGEASALHCIVLHLIPHHPDLLQQLRQELQTLLEPGGSAEISITDGCVSDLHEAAERFQVEIDLVQGEMDRFPDCYKSDGESGTGPLAVLQRLLEDARELSSGLTAELEAMLVTAQRLLAYFGDRQKAQLAGGAPAHEAYAAIEKFFATIREFVQSFEECWREVMENPRRLRLVERRGSQASTHVSSPGNDSPRSVASVPRQSHKATSSAAANQKKMLESTSFGCDAASTVSGSKTECDVPVKPEKTPKKDAVLAAEVAAAVAMRRKTAGMLRDFGPARYLPGASISANE
jgi:hypothetical protein